MSEVRILIGDVRERLRDLPDESVHCVVTSPPYWGLRDYGTARWEGGKPDCQHRVGNQVTDNKAPGAITTGVRPGVDASHCKVCGARRVDLQLGLEPTLGEHITVMVDVFREVRRVLRKDGTLWLNYGDCYATSPNGRSAADTKAAGNDDRTFRDKPFSTIGPVYDPAGGGKGGGPRGPNKGNANDTPGGRICAGGYLKAKDLCMVPNRLAIALQEDGWWVRSEIIWHKPNPMPESIKDRPATSHEKVFLLAKSERYFYDHAAVRTPALSDASSWKQPDGWDTGEGAHGSFHRKGREKGKPADKQRGHSRRHAGFNERWDAMERAEQIAGGANLKNVWTIPTAAFSEAHFATFPPALAETCIKAGCPIGGTVLDPFGGSGTTGLVADRLGRDAILIELNPEYADIARRRIAGDAGMFAKIAAE